MSSNPGPPCLPQEEKTGKLSWDVYAGQSAGLPHWQAFALSTSLTAKNSNLSLNKMTNYDLSQTFEAIDKSSRPQIFQSWIPLSHQFSLFPASLHLHALGMPFGGMSSDKLLSINKVMWERLEQTHWAAIKPGLRLNSAPLARMAGAGHATSLSLSVFTYKMGIITSTLKGLGILKWSNKGKMASSKAPFKWHDFQ